MATMLYTEKITFILQEHSLLLRQLAHTTLDIALSSYSATLSQMEREWKQVSLVKN